MLFSDMTNDILLIYLIAANILDLFGTKMMGAKSFQV